MLRAILPSYEDEVKPIWVHPEASTGFESRAPRHRLAQADRERPDDRAERAPLGLGVEPIHIAWTTMRDPPREVGIAAVVDGQRTEGAPDIVRAASAQTDPGQ